MIVTDFDGTLFTDSHTFHKEDIDTLIRLGETGILRVIATGRSLFSANKVIPPDFPIDYLVFSSGAGIMEWKRKEIIKAYSLDRYQIKKTSEILINGSFNFMLHKKIPDNHYFYYIRHTGEDDDFDKRCKIYTEYSIEWDENEVNEMEEACQFVVMISQMDNAAHLSRFTELKSILGALGNLHVIRATSPLDKKTLWIEIFPAGVSKAHAIKTIADLKGIDYKYIAAVGNDFNDLDMLRWAKTSFIVGNAPLELKNEFVNVKTNNDCGFSDAVKKWMALHDTGR
ncbi:MAG: HAD family hydrolase [Spirochaetia bacterium]|jgi:Cof subfamily protein (haloacid dehalogenase superfamily)|nr:HAD family hydrolase [Spirochaetia bacterium]